MAHTFATLMTMSLLLGGAACASTDSNSDNPAADPQPVAATEAAATARESAPPSAPVTEQAVAGDTFPVEIEAAHFSERRAGNATLRATSENGGVTVNIRDFTHYCSPAPVFVATRDDATLRLTVQPPVGPVTRCVGLHTQTLSLGRIDAEAWLEAVEIVDQDGETQLRGRARRTP